MTECFLVVVDVALGDFYALWFFVCLFRGMLLLDILVSVFNVIIYFFSPGSCNSSLDGQSQCKRSKYNVLSSA